MHESLAGVGGELKPAWSPDVITRVCRGFAEEAWVLMSCVGVGRGEWEVSPEKGLPHIRDKVQPGRSSLGVRSPAEGTKKGPKPRPWPWEAP